MDHSPPLSDFALLSRLTDLTKQSNVVEAQLIEHLAEFLARALHERFSLESPFAYVTTVLGFSRDVAIRRIRAAKAVVVRPEALEHLWSGELSVSSLAALSPAIHLPLALEYALGRTKREVEDYVALRLRSESPRGYLVVSSAKVRSKRAKPGELTGELIAKARTVSDLLAGNLGAAVEPRVLRVFELALDSMLGQLADLIDETTLGETENGAVAAPEVVDAAPKRAKRAEGRPEASSEPNAKRTAKPKRARKGTGKANKRTRSAAPPRAAGAMALVADDFTAG